MHKSWFSAASSSEATEYEKLAVDEEFVGDRSEYKWKRRFQAMGAAYAITILCLVAAYFFHGKNKIGVEWNLPTDVTFGHSKKRLLWIFFLARANTQHSPERKSPVHTRAVLQRHIHRVCNAKCRKWTTLGHFTATYVIERNMKRFVELGSS